MPKEKSLEESKQGLTQRDVKLRTITVDALRRWSVASRTEAQSAPSKTTIPGDLTSYFLQQARDNGLTPNLPWSPAGVEVTSLDMAVHCLFS